MLTSSLAVGMCPADQLAGVSQSPLTPAFQALALSKHRVSRTSAQWTAARELARREYDRSSTEIPRIRPELCAFNIALSLMMNRTQIETQARCDVWLVVARQNPQP